MELDIKGKTCLITGGSSGIGRGISLVLAEEGVNIAIASRNPNPKIIEELSSYRVEVRLIRADVSKEKDVIAMVAEAIKELGHLDFYVNNAGWAWHQPVSKINSESWYSTIDTNLSGAMWACRSVAKHMIEREQGNILLVSSLCRYTIGYGETSYRVSKYGLDGLKENLAVELSPYRIRVNMITPGHFLTRMTGWDRLDKDSTQRFLNQHIPMQRSGDVKDVGYAAAYLLSDRVSGYVTGADITVDGGGHLNAVRMMSNEEIKEYNE